MTIPPGGGSASVSASGAGGTPTVKDAIDAYLAEPAAGNPTSLLAAGLRDARDAVQASLIWLATMGYLVLIEQIGHVVQTASAPVRNGEGSRASFVAAARAFGTTPILSEDGRNTLYDLRCALSHQYGLESDRTWFSYDVHGPILQPPVGPEDSRVNMKLVWRYVENLVTNLRLEHLNGNVILVSNADVTPDYVLSRLRFNVGL